MGWNPFKSKTEYYVSSSTVPIFDGTKRINQYEAAILDQTGTSSLEQSEYFRLHYNNSRLRAQRGLLKQASSSGYNSTIGKINAVFYGDAKIDNTIVTEAIRSTINPPDGSFGVYRTVLSFFSEDFYIKYLATKQGKANLVYQATDTNYKIEYPTPTTIKAIFSDGTEIKGTLPDRAKKTRFLEISYSIAVLHTEEVTTPEGETTTVTTCTYEYGYYHYQEGSGNYTLDRIIANNGIKQETSFYPVVPLRANTAQLDGDKASAVGKILRQLEFYSNTKSPNDCYGEMKKAITDGMKEGNIGDIDYITMIFGVPINSRNNSDQRYLFEFFYNCYTNDALERGIPPEQLIQAKDATSGSGSLNSIYLRLTTALENIEDANYYHQFHLQNNISNFNYTYGQAGADYLEMNGQQRPGAEVNSYGVLAGEYIYEYAHLVPARDAEGNIMTSYSEDTGYQVIYEREVVQVPYNLTLFCHQTSQNRQRTVMFADLKLVNLVYAGKTILTDAYQAVRDAETTTTLAHDFSGDYDGLYSTQKLLTFTYVEATGDNDSAFIVPLEQNTFYEIGTRHDLEIIYACQYLVFNCWESKKVKWYQHGQFGTFFTFVLVCTLPMFTPIQTVAVAMFAVLSTAKMLELTQKVLSLVFGERQGYKIVHYAVQAVKMVLQVVGTIAAFFGPIGQLVQGICMSILFVINAAEVLQMGGSLSQALKTSAKSTTIAAASSAATAIGMGAAGATTSVASVGSTAAETGATTAGTAVGTAGATAGGSISVTTGSTTFALKGLTSGVLAAGAAAGGFTQGLLSSKFSGESQGESFKSGLIQGAVQGGITYLVSEISGPLNMSVDIDPSMVTTATSIANTLSTVAGAVFKNPMTYVNLMNMVEEERMYHKMANLENDYQEFNNQLQAAQKVLNQLYQSTNSTMTAEYLCTYQLIMGRVMSLFPEICLQMTPEQFITTSLTTGSDIIKCVLGSIPMYVENQMSMNGFSPESLHYSQNDNSIVQDQNLSAVV